MREIKFRGKRKDNGNWVCGYYVGICAENTNNKHFIVSMNNAIKYEINIDTLGQYIGLKDLNGKDIFEGDIVKWGHVSGGEENPIRIAKVSVCPDIVFFSNVGIFHFATFMYKKTHEWLEIIGNIHENPEILKESEEK